MTHLRVKAVEDVRVVDFDGDAVAFNPFSWETHLLNPAAALVLGMAAAAPCTEADVAQTLEDVLEESERSRAPDHAQRLLRELIGLRLLDECRVEAGAGC